MTAVVVDTSALVAILMDEPEREALQSRLERASSILVSAATVVEARIVLRSKAGAGLALLLDDLLSHDRFKVVAVDAVEADAAYAAQVLYGKGSGHPARLNFGDLFSYALAKTRRLPLLFKGGDFVLTDIEDASSR